MIRNNTYESLFLKTEMGVVYHDRNGDILQANPAACTILGFSEEELINKSSINYDWQGIHEDGSPYPGSQHPVMEALKTGKTIRKKIIGIIAKGREKRTWLEIDAVPDFNPDDSGPFQVVVTFKDITEKQLVKMDLLTMELRYKALFQNSPIGVAFHEMVYDDSGNPVDYYFLDANENYLALTGVDPRHKKVTEAFPGIEKDPGDWIGTFYSCIRDKKTIRFQQYLEPNDRWYDVVGYQSAPHQFVAAFVEITEQKKKELELQKLKDELEQKVLTRTSELNREKERAEAANRAKTTFLANMSHELRTPLNAVLGYAEILQTNESDMKKKQYLNTVVSSGNLLLQLINDVLDLAKIEAGKIELEYAPCSLQQVLQDLSPLFQKSLSEKNLDYSVNISGDVPDFLLLDEIRIRQILLNLIGNAVKFTNTGGISISCGLLKEEEPKNKSGLNLQLEVKDTGKGVAPEDKERIFGAFKQAKNQKINEYGGTGLGLAVSRDFARRMGGDIQLESAPARGSIFRLILRGVEWIPSDKIKEDFGAEPVETEPYEFEPAEILICDDIDYNRDLIAAYLENQPFQMHFASHGEEALEKIERHVPDLIFLDMKMPIMDGYSLSKLLRENSAYSKIPIIAVTASSLKNEDGKILKFCDRLLRKPVSRKAILQVLAEFLPGNERSHDKEKREETSLSSEKRPQESILQEFRLCLDEGNMDSLCSRALQLKENFPEYSVFANSIYSAAEACDEKAVDRLLEKEKE